MKVNKIIRIVIGLVIVCIAAFQLKMYIQYTNIRDDEGPIKYKYIDKVRHRGGRGEYYEIKILYRQTEAVVDITSKNYYEIDKDKFPALFYSKENNLFFSEWVIKKKMRIALMLFSFSLLAFFPFEKLKKSKG